MNDSHHVTSVSMNRRHAVIQITVSMLIGGLVGWGIYHLTDKPPETFVYTSINFPEGASPEQVERIHRSANQSAERVVGVQQSPLYRLVQAIASIGFFSILGGMIGAYAVLKRVPKPS